MAKPGDRVAVTGIFKAVPPRAQGTLNGNFRAVLVGNHVRQLNMEAALSSITEGPILSTLARGRSTDPDSLLSIKFGSGWSAF